MPHIIVEYSANLEAIADIGVLLDSLHAAAIETGMFPIGGLRVRAAPRQHYRIADLQADNAFCHVTLRVGHGRTVEARRAVCEQLFRCVSAHFAPVYAERPLSLSLEMQEIDPRFSLKQNNIHERIRAQNAAPGDSG